MLPKNIFLPLKHHYSKKGWERLPAYYHPYGDRTRNSALRGRRLNQFDQRAKTTLIIIHLNFKKATISAVSVPFLVLKPSMSNIRIAAKNSHI